jgi:hypothetical protein
VYSIAEQQTLKVSLTTYEYSSRSTSDPNSNIRTSALFTLHPYESPTYAAPTQKGMEQVVDNRPGHRGNGNRCFGELDQTKTVNGGFFEPVR